MLDAHNRAFAFFGGVPRKVIYDSGAWPPSVRGQAERRRLLMRCLRAKSASSTGDFWHWPAIICLNRLRDPLGRIALPAAALHSRLRLGSSHWAPLVQAHWRGAHWRGAHWRGAHWRGARWRGARSETRSAPILHDDPREWLFTPTPRFADFAALNAWACHPLPGTGRAPSSHSRGDDRRDIRIGTADAAAGQHAV